jgi:hypothetical protein
MNFAANIFNYIIHLKSKSTKMKRQVLSSLCLNLLINGITSKREYKVVYNFHSAVADAPDQEGSLNFTNHDMFWLTLRMYAAVWNL